MTDDYENFSGRHRFGATASDTLRNLHRAADLELADEGGIAELRLVDSQGKDWKPPTYDSKAMRWLIVGLVCFWVGLILAVRGCA